MQNNFFKLEHKEVYNALAPLGLVLCGGYSRDMLLGREPKDMDFVILSGRYLDRQDALDSLWPLIQNAMNALGAVPKRQYFQYGTHFACVAEFVYGDTVVQFLFPRNTGASSPLEAVEQFQWNFNHAYFDGAMYRWAPGVIKEVSQRTAVWKCCSEYPRIAEKYKEYFPDWDFSLYP